MISILAVLLCAVLAAQTADAQPARKGGSRQPVLQNSKGNNVPAHLFDLMLGRPTTNSVTVSVLCYADAQGVIAYGTQPGKLSATTRMRLRF